LLSRWNRITFDKPLKLKNLLRRPLTSSAENAHDPNQMRECRRCWGGAYEALKKLKGVAAVRPIPNAEHSTAEVYLDDQSLPDLDRWPEEFAQTANGSYDFRGVEVTILGTLREQDGRLQLIGPSVGTTISLRPLSRGSKLQWDRYAKKPMDASLDELGAYASLERWHRDSGSLDRQVRVTGPLSKIGIEWSLYVRRAET
jgi:galactose oxidase